MLISTIKKRKTQLKIQSKLDLIKDEAELSSSEDEYVARKHIASMGKPKLLQNKNEISPVRLELSSPSYDSSAFFSFTNSLVVNEKVPNGLSDMVNRNLVSPIAANSPPRVM